MSAATKLKTHEQWLMEACRLRETMMAAEADLLLFLIGFEESEVWKDAGFNTFAMVIRQYNLTRPERYAEFKAARSRIDDSVLRRIGVGAAVQANRIKDKKVFNGYVEEAKLRVEDAGFPWSDEQAERQRMRVAPDPPKPPVRLTHDSKLRKMLAEKDAIIEELQVEIEELRRENAELRAKKARSA